MIMAKLTKEQWVVARAKWERSKKEGFEWLADELGVARQSLNERAKTAQKPDEKPALPVKKTDAANKESKGDSLNKIMPHGNSKYQEDYAEQAYKLCLLGATDNTLADFFEVSEQTINNWIEHQLAHAIRDPNGRAYNRTAHLPERHKTNIYFQTHSHAESTRYFYALFQDHIEQYF